MRRIVYFSIFLSTAAAADSRFAPVELKADVSALPLGEKKALRKLVDAARIIDGIFLRQVWAGNTAMLLDLATRNDPALGDFVLYKGPWNRLDHDKPFVAGAPPKPPQAAFYPLDVTKADVEAWQKSLIKPDAARARGFFTVIRKDSDGKLRAVPYSTEYAAELAEAARLLREAAGATADPLLKKFLETRARAFATDDYYDSDIAWMALDGAIEPTIGPYEVYEDDWFNAKAAFEAFIGLRDEAETKRLQKFSSALQDIENHLPIDPKLRNPKIGAAAPIRVINQIFAAGDASHGVQTAAYNLPNDERVIHEKGSKRVMLKNVQRAKFDSVLVPIAKIALPDGAAVDFDAFFTHILMHELLHGLGPHTAGGKTVREVLESSYSAIEEAKADASGLWAMQYLVDKGLLDKKIEATMYETYLASAFRSIRFGTNEAHGKGQALQLNFLLDAGAFSVAPDGRFSVDHKKIKDAVRALAQKLLTVEGHGDKAEAKKLLDGAVVRPPVQKILDRLKDVPVDIAPKFPTAESLSR